MAFVYVFQSGDENLYKIGRTKSDVEKRRKDLSTGNPNPLKTYRVIETERDSLVENYLHKKFAGRLSRRSDAKEFYEIEQDELDRGLADTEEFMADYLPLLEEAEKLKGVDSNGRIIDPDREALAIYEDLQQVTARINTLAFEKTILENRLKKKIGECDGIEGVASWKTQISIRLNQDLLKQEQPDIFKQYQSESKQRTFRLV